LNHGEILLVTSKDRAVHLRRPDATELVARIGTRCSGARQLDRGPAVDRRVLVALPKGGGKLSVRIERVPPSCGQVP